MNLWMLRPIDAASATRKYGEREVKRWTWDCVYGFLVRSETEEGARALASVDSGEEGEDAWTDPNLSTCVAVSVADGPAEVLMHDFLAS